MKLNETRCADGGVMVECYKDPSWGQVNLRTFPPGARSNPHRHLRTNELWMIVRGELVVYLEGWSEYIRSGNQFVVPAGTGHMVENVGGEEAVLVYKRSTVYDPDDPDKEPWTP